MVGQQCPLRLAAANWRLSPHFEQIREIRRKLQRNRNCFRGGMEIADGQPLVTSRLPQETPPLHVERFPRQNSSPSM